MEENKIKPRTFLPKINTPAYHILLSCVAIFLLGPLGAISAAYMNFSIGFFVCGQVLAGILGSVVTYGYGSEGKHGANYIQSMSASVANLSGMAVLIQAMVWLGFKQPPLWELILFFTCVGMFGVGVGMLYTPILVDRMQLAFPSGYAVANILRALTDKALLKQSVAKLGGGALAGLLGGTFPRILAGLGKLGAPELFRKLGAGFDFTEFSASTVGAGLVVGARIAVPSLVVAIIGYELTPWLRSNGWIGEKDQFKKIGFIVALGTILGAAVLDMAIIACQAIKRLKEKLPAQPQEDWKKINTRLLIAWVIFWAVCVMLVSTCLLHQPLGFVAFAVGLSFVFLLVNGISDGISDWNPISSAFVLTVMMMAALGLKDPTVGLMCGAILLVACNVGVDMQQDRSTGWRLGTNRVIQFRYQVIGIVMGSALSVLLAKVFLSAYPVLQVNSFAHPDAPGLDKWQSAMTFKLVGALEGLTHPRSFVLKALELGIAGGFVTEVIRKLVKNNKRCRRLAKETRAGRVADFVFDAIVMPSPYASSFGGFVSLPPTIWFATGGIITSSLAGLRQFRQARRPGPASQDAPSDMSATSLVGGGLIAGDSLAALGIGLCGLLAQLL
ncbi:MAG: OPT/YSL family transporter [Verrucomicrobiota bacterium]